MQFETAIQTIGCSNYWTADMFIARIYKKTRTNFSPDKFS